MSAKQDPELKDYVQDFRKKVEKIYLESKINKTYKFPRVFNSSTSQISLLEDTQEEKELEQVTYYDLRAQNKEKDLDAVDQLVELVLKLGKRDRNELRVFLG